MSNALKIFTGRLTQKSDLRTRNNKFYKLNIFNISNNVECSTYATPVPKETISNYGCLEVF